MAFSQSPHSGDFMAGGHGLDNPPWDHCAEWQLEDYSTFTEVDKNLKSVTSMPMIFPVEVSRASSPYYCDSNSSEFSTPSPSSPSSLSSSPASPRELALSRRHQQSITSTPQTFAKPRIPKEDLTPKQLKRRLQNRVSQQAVRRRRNSPARILESRLQELDHENSGLTEFYTNNIDSCIQTLSAEIETLKELKVLLATGSIDQARFNSLLLKTGTGVLGSPGLGAGGKRVGGRVDQSPAYQNHDFSSSIPKEKPQH